MLLVHSRPVLNVTSPCVVQEELFRNPHMTFSSLVTGWSTGAAAGGDSPDSKTNTRKPTFTPHRLIWITCSPGGRWDRPALINAHQHSNIHPRSVRLSWISNLTRLNNANDLDHVGGLSLTHNSVQRSTLTSSPLNYLLPLLTKSRMKRKNQEILTLFRPTLRSQPDRFTLISSAETRANHF